MSKLSQDLARYRAKGYAGKQIWLNPAIWSIVTYRLGNWLYTEKPGIVIRIPAKILYFLANMFCEVVMEMCIDPHATIGGGLYFGHIGGIHINPGAIIGKDCDIAHRVTIGSSAMGRKGIPVLGDNIYIGTGATLIGRLRVGNGAKIAANTLVIGNVPEGATVIGVPGSVYPAPPRPTPPADVPVVEAASAS